MKPLVYSYTFLSEYENCPYKAYRRFVVKDIPFTETTAMRWGIDVHEALEHRVAAGKPLPETMRAFEPVASFFAAKGAQAERKVAIRRDATVCDFFAKDVFLRGKVDVSWQEGDTLCIADYKTGKRREEPFEMELFALMLRPLYPDVLRVKGSYVWLKEMKIGKPYDLSDTATVFEGVLHRAGQIEHNAKHNHWPVRENPLCGWCPVKDCKHNRSA